MFLISKYNFSLILLLLSIYSSILGEKLKSDYILSFNQDSVTIYIILDDFHTAFLLPNDHFVAEILPELNHLFKDYSFIEISWGDQEFFQAAEVNINMALKALFLPTNSVIRLAGFKYFPDFFYRHNNLTKLTLSIEMLKRLLKFINNSFEKSKDEQLQISLKYSEQIIYFKSNIKYHLLYTCNTWAARGLKRAGFDINSFGLIHAYQLKNKLIQINNLKY